MAAGTLPISVAIAPDSTGKFGKFVYVANDNSNNVSMFSINADGTLTAAGTVDVGDSPVSVAVHPSGKFAYVASNSSCQGDGCPSSNTCVCYDNTSVYVFNINSTTGALTLAEIKVYGGNGPTSMAVDPSGNFVGVTNDDGGGLLLFSIDSTTGALSGYFAVGPARNSGLALAVHPSGTLLAYVTNFPNDVWTYGYDIATGAQKVHGTVAAGSSPTSITIDPSGKFAYVGNSGSLNVSMYSINADGTLAPLVPGTIGL
jgi:6-phosphogluconolactonase (cycloisomerase 2 family)